MGALSSRALNLVGFFIHQGVIEVPSIQKLVIHSMVKISYVSKILFVICAHVETKSILRGHLAS